MTSRPAADRLAPGTSPRGRAAAQSLIDVHDGLRRELAQVRSLVAGVVDGQTGIGTARGELQRLSMTRHDWTTGAYCSTHCLEVAQHHYGEDHEIFPLLRGHDASLGPVLDRLESEHVTIHDLIVELDDVLITLVSDEDPGRVRLRQVLDRFGETLLAHLSYEEDELLAPMAEAFG